jgi:hypothetical protein
VRQRGVERCAPVELHKVQHLCIAVCAMRVQSSEMDSAAQLL